jgi:hypothetical protein
MPNQASRAPPQKVLARGDSVGRRSSVASTVAAMAMSSQAGWAVRLQQQGDDGDQMGSVGQGASRFGTGGIQNPHCFSVARCVPGRMELA